MRVSVLNKSSQIRRLAAKLRNGHVEQSWLCRFWWLLGSIAFFSAATIFQVVQVPGAELDEEVSVSVSVKAAIGLNQQMLVGKLHLVIDRHPEKGMPKRPLQVQNALIQQLVGGIG